MTQVLHEKGKFYIEGTEVINPEVLPLYIRSYVSEGHSFTLPDGIEWEKEVTGCGYDNVVQDCPCELGEKCKVPITVIRLKLKSPEKKAITVEEFKRTFEEMFEMLVAEDGFESGGKYVVRAEQVRALIDSLSLLGDQGDAVKIEDLIIELDDKRILKFRESLNEDMWYLSRKQTAEALLDKFTITRK